MADKKVSVRINRDSVFVGSKELPKGVHSVDAKLAERWFKSGIAVDPSEEDKSSVDQGAELEKVKAELAEANAKIAELEKPKAK